MPLKLFCGADPAAIGISDADGSWDMAKFRGHVESCSICKCGAGKITGMMASRTSPKKATSSRATDPQSELIYDVFNTELKNYNL